ncbi:MAG TPA: hypothetical protein VGN51_21510 [Acidimicrobiia bacterium]|jgi:hypothetical protein
MTERDRSTTHPHPDRPTRAFRWATLATTILALAFLGLGVVDPPRAHDTTGGGFAPATSAMWIVRIVIAAGAGVCFLLGPGIVWRRIRPRGLISNTAFLWIPGAVYLFVAGLVAWGLAHYGDPAITTALLLLPVPVAVLVCVRQWTPHLVPTQERTAIALFLLVFSVGVGVSVWSQGPEGELYGGTISRTLEAGPRSDSRISYHVIELLAHGDSPYSAIGASYYAPYNFYARGPLAGLGAGAVVMAGHASPERAAPEAPWEPFDRQGFMTYRIMMMLMNATAVLAAFGLASTFLRPRFAVAAAALVALSPFVVYQTYFTWPKLLAASYTLAAAVALVRRRPLVAGLLLGLGYLAHPSTLFAVPSLLLALLVLRQQGVPLLSSSSMEGGAACVGPPGFVRWCRDAVVAAIGLGAVYYAWQLANAGHVVNYFSDYLSSAYGHIHASPHDWVNSRLDLTANTFVPFRQAFTDAHDRFTNVVGGRSPFLVRVGEQWRGTVTVAVGLIYLPMFVYGFVRFARRAWLLAVVMFLLPVLSLIVFWGANTTGLLQEGLHATFLLALLASFVGHTALPHSRVVGRWVRVSATARIVEIAFIVGGPTIATTGLLGGGVFRVTDVFALALLVASGVSLVVISWRAFAPDRVGTVDVATASRS